MSKLNKIENSLLIIDCQEDFYDKEETFTRLNSIPSSGLPVQGASEDGQRIIQMLLEDIERFQKTNNAYYSQVNFTLDTHLHTHIGHTGAWIRKDGEPVEPGVIFKLNDDETEVMNATQVGDKEPGTIIYRAAEPCLQSWNVEYVKQMINEKKISPLIWNTHCICETKGWCIESKLWKTAVKWSLITNGKIFLHEKGENPLCEMYSVMKATIPYEEMIKIFDIAKQKKIINCINLPSTKAAFPEIKPYQHGENRNFSTRFNEPLFKHLCGTPKKQKRLHIVGQAKSHCVNFSTRDILERIEELGMRTNLVVLLENMMSNVVLPDSVPNSACLNKIFKEDGETFINDMKKKGVIVM
jgi:nicotinamidase-related amidase